MNELLAQLLRASQHRFIGRLAADPEVRFFESGSCVCNARLLINKPGAKRDDGQKPDAFKIELWNDLAQAFADICHKGDLVDVTGRVRTETWTDRTTGEERRGLTVTVDRWEPPTPPAAAPAAAPAPAKSEPDWFSSSADNDDIPF
jgi:single-strand DNA-binding protein